MFRYQIESPKRSKTEREFLEAASKGDLSTIESMLTNGTMTLSASECGRPFVELALYRLKDNIDGVRLLLDKYQVPLPDDFLRSTNSRVVAAYLIKEKGMDPYKAPEDSQNIADEVPFFSEANIARLRESNEVPYTSMRKKDYRTIGETLATLTDAMIVSVKNGLVYRNLSDGKFGFQAPRFQCASEEDTHKLRDFLNNVGLTFYVAYPGNIVYSREALPHDSCDFSSFIKTIGEKAGIFEKLSAAPEERNQSSLKLG